MPKTAHINPPTPSKNDSTKNTPNVVDSDHTIEATYFLGGLFGEFKRQVVRYQTFTKELMQLEARIEITEKTLCVIRDHLALTVQNTDTAIPHDWQPILDSVRFVGLRLTDACSILLQKHQRLTQKEMIRHLNEGMYRFRTNSPLRETHAALLRHPSVKRDGDSWVWEPNEMGEEEPLRPPIRNGTAHN